VLEFNIKNGVNLAGGKVKRAGKHQWCPEG
jgi:hypothetical protein